MDWLYPLSGFVVGALVGLTGMGGGSLMTPLLILLFGIHPLTAVGTNLLYAAVFCRSVSRRSAGTSAPPKRWRPHSVIGCRGVFCRSSEQLHSTPGVWRLAKPGMKFLNQAGFP